MLFWFRYCRRFCSARVIRGLLSSLCGAQLEPQSPSHQQMKVEQAHFLCSILSENMSCVVMGEAVMLRPEKIMNTVCGLQNNTDLVQDTRGPEVRPCNDVNPRITSA